MDLNRVFKRYVKLFHAQKFAVKERVYLEREKCAKEKYHPRCAFMDLYIFLITSIFSQNHNEKETEDEVQ